MLRPTQPRRQVPSKHERILDALRGRIQRRELAPGSRLPLRSELESEFDVTTVTLQRAIDCLKDDGFVESRGRSGTFVTDTPPCFRRYALIFTDTPSLNPDTSRLFRSLLTAADNLNRAGLDIHLVPYFEVDARKGLQTLPLLLADVRASRLAGLIFSISPHEFMQHPLLTETTIPTVAVSAGRNAQVPQIGAVYADLPGFARRAIAHLKARGRQRIALLTMMMLPGQEAMYGDAMAQHGLTFRPEWLVGGFAYDARLTANTVRLLFRGPDEERPDALIVMDDHLVPGAMTGLAAAGVRLGSDLDVVAECNYPSADLSQWPVTWLGFDQHETLLAAVAQLRGAKNETPAELAFEGGPYCRVSARLPSELVRPAALASTYLDLTATQP